MNILFLTKRQYMSRDLLDDRYGRFYEIPYHLSKLGYNVDLICHDYRNSTEIIHKKVPNLTITSWRLGLEPLSGFWFHHRRLEKRICTSRPDLIIAASDVYQIIIGATLAKKYSVPFIADLYDNFSSYSASRVPGVLPLFSRKLSTADAVTVVSSSLLRLVEKKYAPKGKQYLLENAVSDMFIDSRDRETARRQFNFEHDRVYIGTAGDLSKDKGVDVLLDAFSKLSETDDRLTLVLAGPMSRNLKVSRNGNILYLGTLEHEQIPVFFSALDIGVVCIRDTDFGRYCFPQKLYEMMACELPLVVADVGEMSSLLENYPALRYRPNDSADMQRAILEQLANPQKLDLDVPTWESQTAKLSRIIQGLNRAQAIETNSLK